MTFSDDSLPSVEIFKQLSESCEAIEVAFRNGNKIDIDALIASFPIEYQEMVRPELQGVLDELRAGQNVTVAPDSDSNYETFNDYTVIEPLARGGMGQVMIAWDEDFSRRVALKEIHPRSADDRRFHQRFQQESVITARLEHPGIPPIYSRGVNSDERPFYTMRLVAGGNAQTLQQAIDEFHRNKPKSIAHQPTFRDLIRRLIDVCNTVGYAHSQGVCHRDLKPANILIGPFGETLVVDWGLAKTFQGTSPSTPESAVRSSPPSDNFTDGVGTRGFVAPESLQDHPINDWPRVDVFSLGAILYCIATGLAPEQYPQPYLDQTAGQKRSENRSDSLKKDGALISPIFRSEVPKTVEAICRKAMSLEPQGRYATPLDLSSDLERYLTGLPVSVLREGLIDRTARWINNNRKLTIASLVLGSLLTISVAVIAIQQTTYNYWLNEKSQKLSAALSVELQLREEESKARKSAELQRQIARKREELALHALRTYGDAITTNETLKNTQGLGTVRRELLEKPLAFFEQILQDESLATNPSWEFVEQLAKLSEEMAKLSFDFADPVACARWNDRSIERYEQLVALARKTSADGNHPLDQDRRVVTATIALAGSYRLRGMLQMPLDKQASQQSLQHALELIDPYSDDPDLHESALMERANIHTYQAIMAAEMGERQLMAQNFERAISEREELLALARDSSANTTPVRESIVARRQTELNRLRQDRAHVGLTLNHGDIDGFFSQFKQHIADLREQIRNGHGTQENRLSLAWAIRNLGIHHRNYGHLDQSQTCLQEALELRQELIRLYPAMPRFRADLAATQSDLATTLLGLGRRDQAIASSKLAVEGYRELIQELPQESGYRLELTSQLHFLGHLYLDSFQDSQAEEAIDESFASAKIVLELTPANSAIQPLYVELLWHQSHFQSLRGDWQKAGEYLSLYWDIRSKVHPAVALEVKRPEEALELWEYCCLRTGDTRTLERIKQLRAGLPAPRADDEADDNSLMGQLRREVRTAVAALKAADQALLAQRPDTAIELEQQALKTMQQIATMLRAQSAESSLTSNDLLEIWNLTLRNSIFVTVRVRQELERWPSQDRDAWNAVWQTFRSLAR